MLKPLWGFGLCKNRWGSGLLKIAFCDRQGNNWQLGPLCAHGPNGDASFRPVPPTRWDSGHNDPISGHNVLISGHNALISGHNVLISGAASSIRTAWRRPPRALQRSTTTIHYNDPLQRSTTTIHYNDPLQRSATTPTAFDQLAQGS